MNNKIGNDLIRWLSDVCLWIVLWLLLKGLNGSSSDASEMMLVSSDHLTRFQSAKALFARMEEESARQQRRTNAAAVPTTATTATTKQQSVVADDPQQQSVSAAAAHNTNIFLIKSKFEQSVSSNGLASSSSANVNGTTTTTTSTRRSLAFLTNPTRTSANVNDTTTNGIVLNPPQQQRKRLTMGPMPVNHQVKNTAYTSFLFSTILNWLLKISTNEC